MAMFKCPDCKKKVSDKAEACPHCGHKFTREEIQKLRTMQSRAKLVATVIVILIAGYCYFSGDSTPQQSAPTATMAEAQQTTDYSKFFEDGSTEDTVVKELPTLPITYSQFFSEFNRIAKERGLDFHVAAKPFSHIGYNENNVTQQILIATRCNAKSQKIENVTMTGKAFNGDEVREIARTTQVMTEIIDRKSSRDEIDDFCINMAVDKVRDTMRATRAEKRAGAKFIFNLLESNDEFMECSFSIDPGI